MVAQAAPAGTPASLRECSAELYQGDRRLGPEKLPKLGSVGFQLFGYSRTGLQSQEEFLGNYYDSAANSWRYPPQDGYLLKLDGTPIKWEQTLTRGQRIDRYGSEYGGFLAPEGLPYTTRSIPPSNLVGNPAAGCNYHIYKVLRPFDVTAGPIAPWFAQLGGGLQYQLSGALIPNAPAQVNVLWLLDNGYLERIV
ncbi:TNT domain-containing protein [Actinokineospora sp. G85]|uniref:TNT domain-containing protein n=1 Tax=Actinokineospora sp. G85 TaxID=3406626 RepID=UPI003C71468B